MNYHHAYHAGSFTDVVKHVMLTGLITSLMRKDTPFCYIDTHAGAGCYDLFSTFASKTKEYETGIEKIIAGDNPPSLVKLYLDCVHQMNSKLTASKFSSLRYYPGSPLIASCLMRPHDRMVVCELQPETYQALRTLFASDKRMQVHHADGFLGLKAFLPPKERRGIVLIDPPYEDPDEFTRIAKALPLAIKRWEPGIYAIWYPIKEKKAVERFHRVLKQTIQKPVLITELTIYPDLPSHLNGCGLAIINPPWQIQETAQATLPWLWKLLAINRQGGYQVYRL